MSNDLILRKELMAFLLVGQAHLGVKALESFPREIIDTKIAW